MKSKPALWSNWPSLRPRRPRFRLRCGQLIPIYAPEPDYSFNQVFAMSPKTVQAVPSLAPDYKPSAKEEYMSPPQLEYFRRKLIAWKEDILRESKQTLHHIQEETLQQPDITDRASLETDMALELRTRDRERKLIAKIDAALERIEQGEYGYCEETGQPIGLPRLEARPIATLCLEAQERHERHERTHRDEDRE